MIILIYFGGLVLAVYPCFAAINAADSADPSDAEERFFVGFLAVMAATFWPLLLVGWLAFLLSRRVWRRVLPVDDKFRVGERNA